MSVPAIAAQKGRDTQLFLWQLSQLCAEKGRNEAKWGGCHTDRDKASRYA